MTIAIPIVCPVTMVITITIPSCGILHSDFMTMGKSIPKTMQSSTLTCPPNLTYIRQFIPDIGSNGIINNYKKDY